MCFFSEQGVNTSCREAFSLIFYPLGVNTMTSEELNTLAELVAEKLWGKFAVIGAASIFQSIPPQRGTTNPAPASVGLDDYISTEQITKEFGCSKQWLYNQRKRYPQCSRLVKNNPHDQRGKRFWSRSYIKKIIHESTEP